MLVQSRLLVLPGHFLYTTHNLQGDEASTIALTSVQSTPGGAILQDESWCSLEPQWVV
ncbi:hypothetical protein HanRHA438_Chr03g0111851 [Helianthus annuus]|nr:hypothetical protein HanRHA438_Chr03g0111851 [Helianthus annuus]